LICDCCGAEFGYEGAKLIATKRFRSEWIAKGAVWFKPGAQPREWNLSGQRNSIPDAFE
jgi:hypothetical protein